MQTHTYLAATLSVFVAVSCAFAQQPGTIRGTVVDEKGQPVPAATVRIDPLNAVPMSTIIREVETDKNGRFSMGDLELGPHKIFAMKEAAGYPNTAFGFYSNHIFPTVTLTSSTPEATLIISIGPPAGVLKGLTKNAATNEAVRATFLLRRAANPDNWISLAQQAEYRVLLPPATDVILEISAPGFKTYYYAGESDPLRRSPMRLASGVEMKFEIQLEPEERLQ